MFGESLVSIVFRLINAGVLFGLGYYFYKKYIKHQLDEKITQKEALLKGLEEQGYFLEGKMHDLENQLKEQEIRSTLLKQKIEEWNIHMQAENVKRAEKYKLYATRAAEHITIKNEIVAQRQLNAQIVPRAIIEARNALIKKFADHTYAQNYLHETVHRLERK